MQGPLDLVLFEGWMLGFQPVENPPAGMELVNEHLANYKVWDDLFDSCILLTVPDNNIVYQWREQAEEKLREEGQGAMTPEQMSVFINRFMPSYNFPQGLSGLKFQLDFNRKPIF
jgi:D-glycerate 3-kinase